MITTSTMRHLIQISTYHAPIWLRIVIIGLFIIGSASPKLLGQSWQANWGSSTHPIPPVWRYDLTHFIVGMGGELSLSAPSNGAKQVQSILATSVTLPESVRFRGQVRLDQPTTKLNHCYILLACYAQDTKDQHYDYVALSIGGGDRHNIALVSLRLMPSNKDSDKRFALLQEKALITATELSTKRAFSLEYDIRCSSDGQWIMHLRDISQGKKGAIISLTYNDPLPIPDKHNSTGLLCFSTSRHNQSMHFKGLRIDPLSANIEDVDENIPPNNPKEPTPPTLLLTEVMANPEAGSEEYLELYNSSDTDTSLEGWSLLIGKHPESIKVYDLSILGTIPSRAYWILTTSPSAITSNYPNAQADYIREYKLPRLNNSGCYIAIHQDEKGIVDDLLYKPSLKQKGERSRKGVSLERISLTDFTRYPENAHNWTSALKSSGYATPTRPNSRLGQTKKESANTDNQASGQTARLYELVQELRSSNKARVTLLLHDLLGQCLIEMQNNKALQWLESLVLDAPTTLSTLPILHRGVIVMQLITSSQEHGERIYSLTFFRP